MTLRLQRHRGVTIALVAIIAAGVFVRTPPLGPIMANAATTNSTPAGTGLRANVYGSADLAAVVGTNGVLAMHNELLSTDPPYGAKLSTGPVRVSLTFDLPAQRGFSTLIVTGPDRSQWQAGPATEAGTTVSAPIRPLGPAGEYTVAWRIISADGHPVQATFPFTLTTPGPGTAAAPSPKADQSGSAAGSDGSTMWLWLAGVSVLLAAGVVLTLRISRARS